MAGVGRWVVIGAVVAACAGAFFVFRGPPSAATPTAPPPAAVVEEEGDPPTAVNPGYVGSNACLPCHEGRVKEFQQSRHHFAGVTPDPAAMPAGFAPGRGLHPSHEPGIRFEMAHAGDDYTLTAYHKGQYGEVPATAKVGLVYGSGGHRDEVFFGWRGDRLYELPVAWLHPTQEWGHTNFSKFRRDDCSRETTYRCLECHTTWFAHVPGQGNKYKPDSFLNGISCERCHGPGREHVAAHALKNEGPPVAVVQPSQLDRERQIDVCAQCHSNAHKPKGPALSYRPGDVLEDHYRTTVARHQEDDHVANQTGHMKASRCYAGSETLTCTTCHNPHRATDAGAVRRACLKCHEPANCKEQPKLPEAVRADCVGCHAPPRVWMNVHFHTAADRFAAPIRRAEHRTGVYPEATQEVLLNHYRGQTGPAAQAEVKRLTAALQDFWLGEAAARAKAHRTLAAVGAARESLRVEPSDAARARLAEYQAVLTTQSDRLAEAQLLFEQRRLPESVRIFEQILSANPTNALARGKLGTAYASLGDASKAEGLWRSVLEHDPNDPYGEAMLGWSAYLADRPAEAAAAFRRTEAIEPFNAKNRYQWGLALLKAGQPAEAAERFRGALQVNPQLAGAHQGLSHALRQLKTFAEAIPPAERAAKLTKGESLDVLQSLADAYLDAGRAGDAVPVLEQARLLATRTAPEQVPDLNRKLADARAK